MSKTNTIKVRCPKCSEEFEAEAYVKVSSDDGNAREDIISGKLFDVTCPKCSGVLRLVYPIEFEDKENKVTYLLLSTDDAQRFESSGKSAAYLEKGKLRIVCTQGDLREKVSMLAAGYDDRIIEMCKLMVKEAVTLQHQGNVKKIYFNCTDKENLKYDILTDDGTMYVTADTEVYNRLISIEGISEILEKTERDVMIDEIWADEKMGGSSFDDTV